MFWNPIISYFRKLFHFSSKKERFEKLILNVEKQKNENNTVPFKVTKITEGGFIVEVECLKGFIQFRHMPWKYQSIRNWEAVYPKLKNKLFFCKIYKIDTSKKYYSILINAEFPQFKKAEFVENNEYKGIIISKALFAVFIDVGYHFNWKCGSHIGMLHKFSFGEIEIFDKIEIGQEFIVKYLGVNEQNHLILDNKLELRDHWFEEVKALQGKPVWVKVHKDQLGNIILMVKDKYNAILALKNVKIERAKSKLKDGEIIYCEVTGIIREKKLLRLRWDLKTEELDKQNNINQLGNIVDDEVKKKLMVIVNREEKL